MRAVLQQQPRKHRRAVLFINAVEVIGVCVLFAVFLQNIQRAGEREHAFRDKIHALDEADGGDGRVGIGQRRADFTVQYAGDDVGACAAADDLFALRAHIIAHHALIVRLFLRRPGEHIDHPVRRDLCDEHGGIIARLFHIEVIDRIGERGGQPGRGHIKRRGV